MAKAKSLHEKREITFAELGALLGTRVLLESGALVHRKTVGSFRHSFPGRKENEHTFNMREVCKVEWCGSISCIGGTMAMIMGRDGQEYVSSGSRYGNHSRSLRVLFFPPISRDWNDATNAVAVKAIDNWLKDGKPRWERLLPKGWKLTGVSRRTC